MLFLHWMYYFFDELAQISAQQVSAIDIIMQKERESNIPFGGVLILGTMDHIQIQPIDQLPFDVFQPKMSCSLSFSGMYRKLFIDCRNRINSQ